jgi:DNA mismatch repair protein MutS2
MTRRPESDAGSGAGESSAESFAAWSSDALDYPAVRALLERFAFTSLGLRAVRELRPRTDEGARDALERVRELLLLREEDELPSLGGVSDPLGALDDARRYSRPLLAEEFASLGAFLEACARLGPWLEEHRGRAPALGKLALPDLAALRTQLASLLDERGEVRSEASPRLARLRRDARELTERIESELKRMLGAAGVRPHLSDFSVHLRGNRRVLAVKARASGRVQGLLHDRSSSGETAFIEPRNLVEPGNRLAGLELDLQREEQRILLELTRELLREQPRLAQAAQQVAELELGLIAVAFAREFDARVPALAPWVESGRGTLVLKALRHPLLVDQVRRGALEAVVPIDVRLGEEFDLLLITGPNTGGKTLALKSVGLAALLVRLGLPVPCGEGSRLPLYTGLAADIGDEQEIHQSLSTFSSHLARIRAGLARADARTLVLLDELGAGTDPDEGAALSDALLEHLLERAVPTIATTHLGKLKEFAFRHARAENACVEFDARTLRPLYRLLVGTPGESCALQIARRLGLDPGLIAKAEERLVRRERDVLELMEKVRGARTQAEQARSQAEDRLLDVVRQETALRIKHDDLARRGELLEAEAQRGLEERVREARARLGEAQNLLSQLPSEPAASLRALLAEIERELAGASLTERRQAFLRQLAKGRYVFVPRYKKRCLVTKVDRTRGEVTVRLGNMSLSVPFDEVTWYESL